MLAGFVSSGHCAGMCGGIISLLSASAAPAGDNSPRPNYPVLAAYNLGRICTYAFAGLLVGSAGSVLGRALPGDVFRLITLCVSALFMLGLAFYLAGLGSFLLRLESLGRLVWRRLEPLGRKILPVRSIGKALVLGLIWGWLPCGLVYTALAWSAVSGSALSGASLMLGFGIGTLPAVMLIGIGALDLQARVLGKEVRYAIAALMVILAGYMVYMAAAGILDSGTGPDAHSHAALASPQGSHDLGQY